MQGLADVEKRKCGGTEGLSECSCCHSSKAAVAL